MSYCRIDSGWFGRCWATAAVVLLATATARAEAIRYEITDLGPASRPWSMDLNSSGQVLFRAPDGSARLYRNGRVETPALDGYAVGLTDAGQIITDARIKRDWGYEPGDPRWHIRGWWGASASNNHGDIVGTIYNH